MSFDQQLTVSLDIDQLDWIERAAEYNGVSKAAIVRALVSFAINQEVIYNGQD